MNKYNNNYNNHFRKQLSGQVVKKQGQEVQSNPHSNNESFERNLSNSPSKNLINQEKKPKQSNKSSLAIDQQQWQKSQQDGIQLQELLLMEYQKKIDLTGSRTNADNILNLSKREVSFGKEEQKRLQNNRRKKQEEEVEEEEDYVKEVNNEDEVDEEVVQQFIDEESKLEIEQKVQKKKHQADNRKQQAMFSGLQSSNMSLNSSSLYPNKQGGGVEEVKNKKQSYARKQNNDYDLSGLNNSKTLVDFNRIQLDVKRSSKSGKVTPTKKKLEGIKDFQVAYKKLANNLLKQLMSEQMMKQVVSSMNQSQAQLNNEDQQRFLQNEEQYKEAMMTNENPLSERTSALNSLNETKRGGNVYSKGKQYNAANNSSIMNKSCDSKAKLLLISEKDIINYFAGENGIGGGGDLIGRNERGTNDNLFSQKLSIDQEQRKFLQQKNVYERLYEQNIDLQKKKNDMVQLKDEAGLSECTFQPNITSSGLLSRRSNEEFYKDMITFQKQKEFKLKHQRKVKEAEELEECRKSKSINRETIGGTLIDNEIYERLYQQNIKNVKNPQLNIQQVKQEVSKERSVSICKMRSPRLNAEEITKKLFEDAQRRNQEHGEKKGQEHREHSKVKISEKSNQVYAGRILKQIERAFIDLNVLEASAIDRQMFEDLLQYLGYTGETLSQKERLLKDAWHTVSKSKQGGEEGVAGVSKRSFIIFINILNNLYLPWMSEQHSQEQQESHDFIVKDEHESQVLHNKFFAFWEYRQKLRISMSGGSIPPHSQNDQFILKQRDINNIEKSAQTQNQQFKPTINVNSEKIASNQINQLQKELEQLNIPFSHEDYLIKKGIFYKNKVKEQEKDQIKKEVSECTFQPKTNKNKSSNRGSNQNKSQNRSMSIFEELYGDTSMHQAKKEQRKDVDKHEKEYQNQKEQCTFKPFLYKPLFKKSPRENNTGISSMSLNITPRSQYGNGCAMGGYSKKNLNAQIKDSNPFRNQKQKGEKENRKLNQKPQSKIEQKQGENDKHDNPEDKKNQYQIQTKASLQSSKSQSTLQNQAKGKTEEKNNSSLYNEQKQSNQQINKEQTFGSNRISFGGVQQNVTLSQCFKDQHEELNNAQDEEDEQEKPPLLYLDVNLGKGKVSRLIIYSGDNPSKVADIFVKQHNLDENKRERLIKAINQQLSMILPSIEEENI